MTMVPTLLGYMRITETFLNLHILNITLAEFQPHNNQLLQKLKKLKQKSPQ